MSLSHTASILPLFSSASSPTLHHDWLQWDAASLGRGGALRRVTNNKNKHDIQAGVTSGELNVTCFHIKKTKNKTKKNSGDVERVTLQLMKTASQKERMLYSQFISKIYSLRYKACEWEPVLVESYIMAQESVWSWCASACQDGLLEYFRQHLFWLQL